MTNPQADRVPEGWMGEDDSDVAAGGSAPEPEETDVARRAHSHRGDRRSAGAMLIDGVKEFVIVAFTALMISFVVKTFLLQAFWIPSGSMEDTLQIGDRVFVNKLVPEPFGLHRGDIVVFQDPGGWLPEQAPPADRGVVLNSARTALTFVGLLPDTSQGHLIKRVIGLPGDRVTCCDSRGRLTVNGVSIDETYVKAGERPSDSEFDITVPPGRVWVMGDNRSNSADSRPHDTSGTGKDGSVDMDLISGRAVIIVLPLDRFGLLREPEAVFAKVPQPGVALPFTTSRP